VPARLTGTTWNHAIPLLIVRWWLGVEGAKQALLAFLHCGETTGHCAIGGNISELGGHVGLRVEAWSTSHAAHDYAAVVPGLLLALQAGDPEVTAGLTAWLIGEMAMLNLCCSPGGTVAVAGARCYVGPPPPQGGGDADQRVQINTFQNYIAGRHVHMPRTLTTADDWLGLYGLKLLDQQEHAPWAASWREIRASMATAGPAQLPVTYDPVEITRGPGGLVVRQLGVTAQMRPALWASLDFHSGKDAYGCLPSWPREYHPKVNDIHENPAPACPGRGELKTYTTKVRTSS